MKTPRIEERYGLLAEQLAKDVLEELDTKDFQHNPAWDIARKQIEKMIYPKLTQAHQAGKNEAVEIVNRHGKQCDPKYHAECIEMIKEALQDNK